MLPATPAQLYSPRTPPEIHLWLKVLIRVVRDAQEEPELLRRKAIYWLTTENNLDRSIVCEYANVDEDIILKWGKKHIKFSRSCLQLSEQQKYNIRELYKIGVTQNQLAIKYRVNKSSISKVVRNKI